MAFSQVELGTLNKARDYGMFRNLNEARFCVTGKMSVPRDNLSMLIAFCGGIPVTRISSTTHFLIIPDWNAVTTESSKFLAARRVGTKIITEAEFCEMIFPTVEELLAGGSNVRTSGSKA